MVNLHALPRSQQIILGATAIAVGTLLVLGTARYGTDLAARLAQGRFTVVAPTQLRPGADVTIRWGIPDAQGRMQPPVPAARQRFPQEKIELVVRQKGRTRVYALAARTPNDGEQRVRLPLDLPKGSLATIRLTAVDAKGRVVSAVRSETASPSTIAAPRPEMVAEAPGGGGGDSEDSRGGGGGGQTTPTVALTRVCIEPTPFSAFVGWRGQHFGLRVRIAGGEWAYFPSYPGESFPLGHTLEDIHDHTSFVLNGIVGIPLQPNQDFELQIFKPEGRESAVYRFNSGPAPRLEQEQLTPCEFRVLL